MAVTANDAIERFLLRQLQGEYGRIRTFETCIVQAVGASPTFRILILAEKDLRYTENPPKTISHLLSYAQIVAIDMVHECPDFLNQQMAHNTEHISIKYLLPSGQPPGKRKSMVKPGSNPALLITPSPSSETQTSPLTSRASVSGSSRAPMSGSSRSSPTPASPALSHSGVTGALSTPRIEPNPAAPPRFSAAKLDLPTSGLLTSVSQPQTPGSQRASLSHVLAPTGLVASASSSSVQPISVPASPLVSPRSSTLRATPSQGSVQTLTMPSTSLPQGKRPTALSPLSSPAPLGDSVSQPQTPITSHPPSPRLSVASTSAHHPSPPSALSVSTVASPSLTSKHTEAESNPARRHLEHRSASAQSLQVRFAQANLSPAALSESRSSIAGANRPSGSGDVDESQSQSARAISAPTSPAAARKWSPQVGAAFMAKSRPSMSSASSITNLSALSSSQEQLNEGLDEQRIGELHLYTIQSPSSLFPRLQTAWESALVASLSDATHLGPGADAQPMMRSESDQIQLFRELMQEIILADSLEERFELVHELELAARRSAVLRKMFWKRKENFCFVMDELRLHTPKSEPLARSTTNKADQLEYVAMLLDLLVIMLRDAENIPERLVLLKLERPYSIREVLTIICACTSSTTALGTATDSDCGELARELADKTVSVLYELISVTHQATWDPAAPHMRGFHFGWLTGEMLKVDRFEAGFMRLFMAKFFETLRLLASGSEGSQTSQSILSLFQQSALCGKLVLPESALHPFIKANFREEFKYMIDMNRIIQNLDPALAINSKTIAFLRAILKSVAS
eukprot:m.358009 g.358009  ORF g.358009 m.358009 type:complete len:804 (+) comp55981_c0_seq7:172-2583(+)